VIATISVYVHVLRRLAAVMMAREHDGGRLSGVGRQMMAGVEDAG
jgi:hypothetical protein